MNRQQKIDQHFNGGEDALTANTHLGAMGADIVNWKFVLLL